MATPTWNIIGEGDVAEGLRVATTYVQPRRATTLITNAETIPDGAITTDHAVLIENAELIVPHLLGFRVIEEVARAVHAGEAGQLYGCYGAYRLPRGSDPENVEFDALLPLVAVVLEIIAGDVGSVWARRASLLAEGDAWFVTLHVGPVIITLEALATTDPPQTSELLLEVTGSEQVLRAEPTAQAIVVEPFDAPAKKVGWWEDAGERLLQIVNNLDERPMTGSGERLRAVWTAIHDSVTRGEPVTLE